MNMTEPIYKFSNGEVCFWIEDGSSIHFKSTNRYGDPVELNAEEAKEIAAQLLLCAARLDEGDLQPQRQPDRPAHG